MDPLRKGIAIGMLFGSGKEAELNDKEVEIDVGDILDALTGIFTYNPEDEDPQGDPPGPWDGYSLFTIDLTAVKQSLEDIIAALQQHDPDYDPDETPPEDAVEDLIEENEQQEQTIEDLTEQVEECDQCKADVIAKLQEYDPDFDPVTCSDIPPEIDKVVEEAEGEGYEFPEGTDPNDPDVQKIVNGNPVTDKTTGITIGIETYINPDNSHGADGYAIINGEKKYYGIIHGGTAVPVDYYSDKIFQITDPSTGEFFLSVTVHWGIAWSPTTYTTTGRDRALIGYGDTSHTYSVSNS